MDKSIRVLLVEDDPEWRRGLTDYLQAEPDICVVAAVETADEVLEAVESETFHVVLMDIMLASRLEGVWLTNEVCRRCRAKVLMLSSLTDKDVILGAFQAGASDYLVKSNFEEIPAAVRAAYESRSAISASVADQLLEEFRRLKRVEREYEVRQVRDKITTTELQVLKMIDQGYTQTEIAGKFVVSLRTIKVHVGNILKKLGIPGSREAARHARELGLFQQEKE